MKINLILPTYENVELTLRCLNSIKKYNDKNYEVNIIWVDNNSSSEFRQTILDFFKETELSYDVIYLGENTGFIKASNVGIKFALDKYAKNKYLGIINNDIEVSENWLKNLVHCFEEDKNDEIQCVGSISYSLINKTINQTDILFNNELKELNSNTFEQTIENLKSLKTCYKQFSIDDFDTENFNTTIIPYYSVLFKTSIFQKIGILDEKFNLGYSDDTEFNYRILNEGYKIAKVFNSIVIHDSRSTFNIFYDNKKINEIQESNKLQLKISKTLNKDKKKKYVIYTCISGNYDKLCNLSNVNLNDFDYICFTNSDQILEQESNVWKVINVKNFNIGIDKDDKDYFVKFARFFKTHPHLFFENYEKSIWIDGNVNIIGDTIEFIKLFNKDEYIFIPTHPIRKCIYDEIKAVEAARYETKENLNIVNKFLLNENYPKDNNLVQSGIILRDHLNKDCMFLMEKWWEMIKNYSKRDQLSFNYIFWKYGGKYQTIIWNILSKSYFNTNYKHGVPHR